MTTYITAADVMKLLGCKESKAYKIIRAVNVIEAGLEANRNYKQIYKDCKERIQMVSRLAFLE